jgi:hypothetical protein
MPEQRPRVFEEGSGVGDELIREIENRTTDACRMAREAKLIEEFGDIDPDRTSHRAYSHFVSGPIGPRGRSSFNAKYERADVGPVWRKFTSSMRPRKQFARAGATRRPRRLIEQKGNCVSPQQERWRYERERL